MDSVDDPTERDVRPVQHETQVVAHVMAHVVAHVVAELETSDEAANAALDAVEGDAAATEDNGDSDGGGAAGEETEREAPERMKSVIESLLFASEKPVDARRLQELIGEPDAEKVAAMLEWLRADYADRGVVLHEVAGGFQFRTNPLNAHWVQQLVAGRPVRLTRAQLETLAIVGYRQPITRPEIDEIRGVDSGGTVKVLLDRGLVRVIGKKDEPGRPMLFGTTKEFLAFFNLRDLRDLPTLREFQELSPESLAKVQQLEAEGRLATEPAEPAGTAGDGTGGDSSTSVQA